MDLCEIESEIQVFEINKDTKAVLRKITPSFPEDLSQLPGRRFKFACGGLGTIKGTWATIGGMINGYAITERGVQLFVSVPEVAGLALLYLRFDLDLDVWQAAIRRQVSRPEFLKGHLTLDSSSSTPE